MKTLIANTGVQIFSQRINVNLQNVREKMYFREWFDINTFRLSLELAHYFANDEVFVRKSDLWKQGFMPNGVVTSTWEEILKQTCDITQFKESEVFSVSCQTLLRGRQPLLDKFLNVWLPFPYFEYNTAGRMMVGPFNWTRIKVIPTGNVQNGCPEWDVVVAIDTRSVYDDGNYSDEYKECPLFPNEFEKFKKFGVCDSDLNLMSFCATNGQKSEWIDKYILQLLHNTNDISKVADEHRFTYLASYIYFINMIRQYANLPDLKLYKDRNVQRIVNVDLVVDMGNSKTTALLVEEGDFTRTDMLRLQNFTQPNKYSNDSFDMNVVFQKADFGEMGLGNSSQFVFPSFLRLGDEAKYLMYNAQNNTLSKERLSICSSPKRYLWDTKKRKYEWEYVSLTEMDDNADNPIWIDGISEQFNEDGTLSTTGIKGDNVCYSRRSLMTLSFVEILAQARMYINSHDWREKWGGADCPRRISKIIVTCPTAMSRMEQTELRKAAEEAFVVLDRSINETFTDVLDYRSLSKRIEIVPSVKALTNTEERTEWTYDEATSSQFVYLCAEIAQRYRNNCEEYFNLYGKVRNDLPNYTKKSLTVGSLDIGAGTTDLMICAYEYSAMGQTTIKPLPLFWESFYIAGDDMLKQFVQQIVIEGPFAMISNKLRKIGDPHPTATLADFFYQDNARMDFASRMIRKDFNLQVSVPIALKYIEEARKQTKPTTFVWHDIFNELQPAQYLLDKFAEHFKFRIEDLEWTFDLDQVNTIIVSQFDDLLRKVAAAMTAYQCDIIILSGRPTSLKQIEDLFLKYYPVSPNRLKVLNNYRVGRWYPFQNGDGYFTSQKSIVAVGALLGYIASKLGGYEGLSFDLSELKDKLLPTTECFGIMNPNTNEMITPFITPEQNRADITVNDLPLKIGTRQLNSPSYPSRAIYRLDFNDVRIEDYYRNRGVADGAEMVQEVEKFKQSVRSRTPLTISICREDYTQDKETLILEDVRDKYGDSEGLAIHFFSLQIQSLSEDEDFWLDSGAFKLSITTN